MVIFRVYVNLPEGRICTYLCLDPTTNLLWSGVGQSIPKSRLILQFRPGSNGQLLWIIYSYSIYFYLHIAIVVNWPFDIWKMCHVQGIQGKLDLFLVVWNIATVRSTNQDSLPDGLVFPPQSTGYSPQNSSPHRFRCSTQRNGSPKFTGSSQA